MKMSCWHMYEDTAVRCMTTMIMWLTKISSFWIISIYIGHSAGIVGVTGDLWNVKSILVTNLFWVTWNPSVRRWRVSFYFTVNSYIFLHTNKMFSFKLDNLRWICTSIWKTKIRLKKSINTNMHWVNCHQLLKVYLRGNFSSSLLFCKLNWF